MRVGQSVAVKRWLALRRWWITGSAASVVAVRILIAVVTEAFGGTGEGSGLALPALTAALDVLAIGLAVVALVAFVQYGRLFNARVPTE